MVSGIDGRRPLAATLAAGAPQAHERKMTRDELERLDRDGLVARAQAAGVTRAWASSPAPSWSDEILLLRSMPGPRPAQARLRLLRRRAGPCSPSVVELGLNLPDAAERIRTLGDEPVVRRSAPSALPPVTLAEIYAAQGHRDRAVETLEGVLAREPEHSVARTLVDQLRDGKVPLPPQRMPPRARGARGARSRPTDDARGRRRRRPRRVPRSRCPSRPTCWTTDPLPLRRYDVSDECVALPVDPRNALRLLGRSAASHARGPARPSSTPAGSCCASPSSSPRGRARGPRRGTRTWTARSGTRSQPRPAGRMRRAGRHRVEERRDVRPPSRTPPRSETPAGRAEPAFMSGRPRSAGRAQAPSPCRPTDPDAASIERALAVARRDETLSRASPRWPARRVPRPERAVDAPRLRGPRPDTV